jgi:hypothetical protein
MAASQAFFDALSKKERQVFLELDTPFKIQSFLDAVPYSAEPVYRCPLRVVRDGIAHCFDGAVFAAAALQRIGFLPLILDMIPDSRDDDHVLALYKRDGHWGAIAKSNYAGLRFREPIFRNLRELVLSYFEQYFNVEREKTLRGYTIPLNLTMFDRISWMTNNEAMDRIARQLDKIRRFFLMAPEMIAALSPVDERSFNAGLQGANEAGLFKPSRD